MADGTGSDLTSSPGAYDVVVLAGGTGERLGGVDKALLRRDGRTLLDRLLDAAADARVVVVVGPERPTRRQVAWTREDPPGGGPGAGLLAGLGALAERGAPAAAVLVVAVDMAYVGPATVARLQAGLRPDHDEGRPVDGAVLVGRDGRRQLCLLLRASATERLRAAYAENPAGIPVHRLLQTLALHEIRAEDDEDLDVDTPDDLDRLQAPASSREPD